jgi:hypothetical protein
LYLQIYLQTDPHFLSQFIQMYWEKILCPPRPGPESYQMECVPRQEWSSEKRGEQQISKAKNFAFPPCVQTA